MKYAPMRTPTRRSCLLLLSPVISLTVLLLGGAAPARAAAPDGTIAYVRGNEQIRLIKPDGTGDQEIWTQPPSQSRYGNVHEVAFRPDGKEIAFSSSHEEAFSYYAADLYAIGLDGKGLRRLTNTPSLDKLARYPKGKVAVTVSNSSTDPLVMVVVVYVVGADKPRSLAVPHGDVRTVTFENVAAIDGALQPVMAAFGGHRWPGPPIRVLPGHTVKASMTLTGRGFDMMGAYRPVWSRDGKQVAYRFGESAGLYRISAAGAPGAGIGQRLGGDQVSHVPAFDWGPPGIAGGSVLYAHGFIDVGETDNTIFQTDDEGRRTTRLLHFDESGKHITQLRWLPDGAGFLFVRGEPMTFGEGANLCRYDLASKRETQLTEFTHEAVRDFALSPDGGWIVFERGKAVYDPWDKERPALWLMRTDGSDSHLLVENAAAPAWGR